MSTAEHPTVKSRRTTRPQVAFALGAAAALGAILTGASLLSARNDATAPPEGVAPAQSASSFTGIAQRGAVLAGL
jgi:hypothetical protein